MSKSPECHYNYHEDCHDEVCQFEATLDGFLEADDKLTPAAQEYRDQLIVGVQKMYEKVYNFRMAHPLKVDDHAKGELE